MEGETMEEGGITVRAHHIKKRALKNKSLSVSFNEKDLKDFVTGFHKRKKKRRKEAHHLQQEAERRKRIELRKKALLGASCSIYATGRISKNPVLTRNLARLRAEVELDNALAAKDMGMNGETQANNCPMEFGEQRDCLRNNNSNHIETVENQAILNESDEEVLHTGEPFLRNSFSVLSDMEDLGLSDCPSNTPKANSVSGVDDRVKVKYTRSASVDDIRDFPKSPTKVEVFQKHCRAQNKKLKKQNAVQSLMMVTRAAAKPQRKLEREYVIYGEGGAPADADAGPNENDEDDEEDDKVDPLASVSGTKTYDNGDVKVMVTTSEISREEEQLTENLQVAVPRLTTGSEKKHNIPVVKKKQFKKVVKRRSRPKQQTKRDKRKGNQKSKE